MEKCEISVKEKAASATSCDCEKEIQQLKIELNRQQQHTRSYNCRIFGMEESENEDLKKKVCSLIGGALGVKIAKTDIAAAHRLPSKNKDRPHPVIVRFVDKEVKFLVLKQRKKLKGTGKSITEDMTVGNIKLLNRAENSKVFQSVWFSNGRVHAIDSRGKHKLLELFDSFLGG